MRNGSMMVRMGMAAGGSPNKHYHGEGQVEAGERGVRRLRGPKLVIRVEPSEIVQSVPIGQKILVRKGISDGSHQISGAQKKTRTLCEPQRVRHPKPFRPLMVDHPP